MKQQIPLKQADALIGKIMDTLRPGCLRIEGAGSWRRCKPTVGDLEIVCIPASKQASMFGDLDLSATWLDDILAGLLRQGRVTPGHANGEKYKSFILPSTGVQIDLFIVTPPEWGLGYTVRTGSSDFSHRLVTQRALSNGWGYMPGDDKSGYYYVSNFRLYKNGWPEYHLVQPEDGSEAYQKISWVGGSVLDTCEERDLFELIGLPWIEPANR